MRFFNDPNFVILDFHCPYCHRDTSTTVHEDGNATCNACMSTVVPPMRYEEARDTYQRECH